VRTFVFQRPLEGDKEVLDRKIEELLAGQFEDGTLGDDEHNRMQFTAESLIDLAELGCGPHRPEVQRAVEVILREPGDDGSDTLGICAVRALCLLGLPESPKVAEGLRHCAGRRSRMERPLQGLPLDSH